MSNYQGSSREERNQGEVEEWPTGDSAAASLPGPGAHAGGPAAWALAEWGMGVSKGSRHQKSSCTERIIIVFNSILSSKGVGWGIYQEMLGFPCLWRPGSWQERLWDPTSKWVGPAFVVGSQTSPLSKSDSAHSFTAQNCIIPEKPDIGRRFNIFRRRGSMTGQDHPAAGLSSESLLVQGPSQVNKFQRGQGGR